MAAPQPGRRVAADGGDAQALGLCVLADRLHQPVGGAGAAQGHGGEDVVDVEGAVLQPVVGVGGEALLVHLVAVAGVAELCHVDLPTPLKPARLGFGSRSRLDANRSGGIEMRRMIVTTLGVLALAGCQKNEEKAASAED